MHGHAESSITCNVTRKAIECKMSLKYINMYLKNPKISQGWPGSVSDPTATWLYPKKESVGGVFCVSIVHSLSHFVHFDLLQN